MVRIHPGVPAAEGPSGHPMAASPPFLPTPASLSTYEAPEWFRNAKFGIWAHWGPQAVPRQGDWYARQMYIPGHPHYAHHLATWGHPSEHGYKDIIPLWRAEKWHPEALMDRYVAAGARYFFSMGVHHDNFELWRSKAHRWNATAMGPRRDIVGEWQRAATARGLKFGVSEHLGASYTWFQVSHGWDGFGPKFSAPYDGANPLYWDLYHPTHGVQLRIPETWYTDDPAFHRQWYERISHMLETYAPDLLYSDGYTPFGAVGRTLVANYFNASMAANGGRCEAVYFTKDHHGPEVYGVLDIERGVAPGTRPEPWQTCSSIGDWFHREDDVYKTTDEVVHMLADIVAKNGCLLLNVTLDADGSLVPEADRFLTEMAAWMTVNAEAIHDTRPWTTYGEGPTEVATGSFQEAFAYTPADIRFTAKGETLYAITLGEPRGEVAIASLGRASGRDARPVAAVSLLGAGPVAFQQEEGALRIAVPDRLPTRHASAFRIAFGS